MNVRPLSAESLLAHEPFVRAVVRGLVRDEAELQDVLQETWLRGLAGAPAEHGALRGWLARVARNLALDQRRGRARRSRRERSVARGEAVPGVDSAYARLSTQREVVDAVLALEEPYRGVVLLRYFEGLEPTAIAAQLTRSPGTVRSQLARAHELLRERLDRKCGREAWAGLAFPLAWRGAELAAGLGLALAAGLLVFAGLRWLASGGRTSQHELALAATTSGEDPSPSEVEPVSDLAPPEEARVAIAPSAGAASEPVRAPDSAEIAALPLEERLALAVQLMRTIEADLVRVDPALIARHEAFLAEEGTGITRVLDGRKANLVLSQGGCAYFSFATREYSNQSEPDLGFHDHMLRSGFYGRQLGLLFDAGPVPLASVPSRPEPIPGWVQEQRFDDWELLWSALDANTREQAARTDMIRHVYPVQAGHTFLLRVQSPGQHDHLVAFSVLTHDEDGCTLLWRTLARWPLDEPKSGGWHYPEEHREVPAGPPWLALLSLEERIQLLTELRASARPSLLEVPRETRDRFERGPTDARSCRLLERDRWDPLLELTWEGAFYSFEKQDHDYQTAILGLDQGSSSGFAGSDKGLFLDLGRLTDAQLRAAWNGRTPPGLESRARDAWDFLFQVQPERNVAARTARFSEVDAARAQELGLRDEAPVAVGHVYLLRSVLFGDRDELVCFQVLDRANGGVSLAWRELARWPIEGQ